MDSVVDGHAKGWNSCNHHQNENGGDQNQDDANGKGSTIDVHVKWLWRMDIVFLQMINFHHLDIDDNEKWHLEQKVK